MADDSNATGNTLLAVIIGGVLVVIVAFFAFGGFNGLGQANNGGVTIVDDDPDTTLELPDVNVTQNPAPEPAPAN